MDVPCFDLTNEDSEQSNPGTSLQNTSSNSHNAVIAYGKEMLDLFERAVVEIKNDTEEDENESNLNKAERYTGLHRNVLLELWKTPIKITKIVEIDRKTIHDEVMKFNLERNIIPNTTDLFNSLQYCLPPYLDIRSFRNELVRFGYIFKKANSKTAVVIENPAVRFERFMYLKKMKQYREEKRPLYFVCEGSLTRDKVLNIEEYERQQCTKWQQPFICMVSSKLVKGFKCVTEGFSFESYILDTIVDLEDNSIIVFDIAKHRCQKICEIPDIDSLKCDMIEWLEHNQIPFKPTMNRIELWSLIEMYTDTNVNMYRLDNMLKHRGIEVIRIPDSLNNLTPEPTLNDIFHKNVERNYNTEYMIKMLEDITQAITEKDLELINTALVAEETRLLELDIKLDEKFDNLSLSTTPEIDTYLPTLSNTE